MMGLALPSLRRAFRRVFRKRAVAAPGGRPEAVHAVRLAELLGRFGLTVPTPDPAAAEAGATGGAHFALGVWLDGPAARGRHPRGLTEEPGGAYSEWLRGEEGARRGLSARGAGNVAHAFASRPFERTRYVFHLRHDLRRTFPLGLTPAGRWDFADWLLRHGRGEHALSAEEVVWFLLGLADDPTEGLADTYLLNADWQRAVPGVRDARGWDRLCRWVAGRERRAVAAWLPRARSCPEAELEARLFRHTRSGADGSGGGRGVNLLGHFHYESGLQAEVEQNAAALRAAGYRVARRDVPIACPDEWRSASRDIDLEVHPVTVLKLGAQEAVDGSYGRAGLHPREGVYRIASWFWELEAFPPEALRRAGAIDEVWSPSEFCAAAVRRAMPDRPVLVMPPAVPEPMAGPVERARFGLPDDRFLFLFAFDLGSVMERKNPLGLIEAFRLAFRSDDLAHLAIKVSRGNTHAADLARLYAAGRGGRVTVIDELLPRTAALGLIAACDAYVSLHRSEGLGLTMAEAMLLGKPTIATAYSGNLDFMTARNSRLVDYRIGTLERDHGPYPKGACWAEPDLCHAAEQMRWAFDHPDDARALGERARADLRVSHAPEAAGRRMAARLDEIRASVGCR